MSFQTHISSRKRTQKNMIRLLKNRGFHTLLLFVFRQCVGHPFDQLPYALQVKSVCFIRTLQGSVKITPYLAIVFLYGRVHGLIIRYHWLTTAVSITNGQISQPEVLESKLSSTFTHKSQHIRWLDAATKKPISQS